LIRILRAAIRCPFWHPAPLSSVEIDLKQLTCQSMLSWSVDPRSTDVEYRNRPGLGHSHPSPLPSGRRAVPVRFM